jgi:hypothetical protein
MEERHERFSPPGLDSIYHTDDYPRAGCSIKVTVSCGKHFVREIAPNGRTIASYAPVNTPEAAGRMVSEWASGKAPSRFPDGDGDENR